MGHAGDGGVRQHTLEELQLAGARLAEALRDGPDRAVVQVDPEVVVGELGEPVREGQQLAGEATQLGVPVDVIREAVARYGTITEIALTDPRFLPPPP